MSGQTAAIELAISELRRGLEVGMANVEGQIALLHQVQEHTERRMDACTKLLDELSDRLAAAERDQVTRAQLEARFRHAVALLGLIATIASVVATVILALLS